MGRRCCCEEECPIFSDDFNRGTTTDVDGWDELVGDSDLVSNELRIPTEGQVRTDISHPHNSLTGVVNVTCVDLQEDREWGVRIGCDVLGAGGDLVVMSCNATHISLSVNGLGFEMRTYTPGEDVDLRVCRAFNGVWANIDISKIVWDCTTDDVTTVARYVALENPSTTDETFFDDFTWAQHNHTLDTCEVCNCDCDGFCVPKTLTLTMTVSNTPPGDCGVCIPDGSEVSLVFDELELGGAMLWKGSITTGVPTCAGTDTYDFTLECESDGVYFLCMNGMGAIWSGGVSCQTTGVGNYPDTTTCDPLELVFPQLSSSYSGGGICHLDFTITV